MNISYRRSNSAAALLAALFIVTILAVLAGLVINKVTGGNSTINQAGTWQEALTAAEAGVHQGIAQVNNQILPYLNQQNSIPGSSTTVLTGTTWSGSVSASTLDHLGESDSVPTATYTIKAYQFGVGLSGATSQQPYFLVTGNGTATIPGGKSFLSDARDVVLRKLKNMRTNASSRATATRKVLVWLRPISTTDIALMTDGAVDMNNHNITLSSFNSSDPQRSGTNLGYTYGLPNTTIDGYYNLNTNSGALASPILGADVGTNSQFIGAGNATIYGDVETNGGTIGQTVTGITNVLGQSINDFYQPLAPVLAPSGTYNYPTVPKSKGSGTVQVTDIKNTITLTGGTKANPARYIVNSVTLAGSGDVVTFDFGKVTGNVDKTQNYVELYVVGDLSTKGGGGTGDGSLVIIDGVNVKITVGGNMNFGGNGITNQNGNASSLSIYGITPAPTGTPPTVPARSASFMGSSQFTGTVYAPAYNLKLGGNPLYIGSIVGKTATLVGNVDFIYDEALAGGAAIATFGRASWFEDVAP